TQPLEWSALFRSLFLRRRSRYTPQAHAEIAFDLFGLAAQDGSRAQRTAAGGQQRASGIKSKAQHRVIVPLEHGQLFAAGRIPQADGGEIVVAGSHHLPVGAEGNLALVEIVDDAAVRIGQAKHLAINRQPRAIRAEGQILFADAGQSLAPLAAGDVPQADLFGLMAGIPAYG